MGLGPTIARSDTPMSNPPGARGSARTSPTIRTEVSRVSCWKADQTPSPTWFLTMTAWATPLPSRSTANAIFPEERRCVTQACRVTDLPTCCPSWESRVFESVICDVGPARTLLATQRARQPQRHGVVIANKSGHRTPAHEPSDMTLRARLTLGLLTIAVILIVPLLSALRSLDRVHEEAKMLRDGDFAASLIVGRLRESLNDLRAAELALLFVRDQKSHQAMRDRILDVQRMADSLAAYGLDRASVEVRAGMGDVAANEEAEFNAASSGRAAQAEQISSQKVV